MSIKKHIFFLLTAVMIQTTIAAPRSYSEAKKVARRVMTDLTGHALGEPAIQTRSAETEEADRPYYIFNNENESGFVIISGSDLMREVIGYSANSSFSETDTEKLPENLRNWLAWISYATSYLEEHPEAALTAADRRSVASPVAPLMQSKWDQGNPYNTYCPLIKDRGTQRYQTGCVATAIGQIVRYHLNKNQKVLKGIGQHEYKRDRTTYSVDFSANTYDYKLMPLSLTSSSTASEINEVSKLLYHIGVGVNMNYAEDGSGAFNFDGESLLKEHFGFNSNISYIKRAYYSYEEWNDLLLNEIQNGRPVLYGGNSEAGGHSFVLEGVDQDGLFYINWGWGGLDDGYFDINLLNPQSLFTGQYASADGFAYYQDAIINICMEEGAGTKLSPLIIDKTLTAEIKGDSLHFDEIIFFNLSTQAATGEIELLLKKETETISQTKLEDVSNLAGHDSQSGEGGCFISSFSYYIPKDLADGVYQLWFYFKEDGKEASKIRAYYPDVAYVTLKVANGKCYASVGNRAAKLVASAWNTDTEDIKTGASTLSVTVRNDGLDTYIGRFKLTLKKSGDHQSTTLLAEDMSVILPGETSTITFNCNLSSAGTYTAKLTARGIDAGEGSEDETEGEATSTFEVKASPSMGANFTMVKSLEILTGNEAAPGGKIKVRYVLSNSGEPYEGEFGLRFFASRNTKTIEGECFSAVSFSKTDRDSVEVELTMPELIENATYYVRGAFLRGSTYEYFSTANGVKNNTEVKMVTTGILEVETDRKTATDYAKASIYNILGKRVFPSADGKLAPGVYIIDGKKTIIHY